MVKSVNSGIKLIDGFGTQMRLNVSRHILTCIYSLLMFFSLWAGGAEAVLTALAFAGTDVAITELDIAGAIAICLYRISSFL